MIKLGNQVLWEKQLKPTVSPGISQCNMGMEGQTMKRIVDPSCKLVFFSSTQNRRAGAVKENKSRQRAPR